MSSPALPDGIESNLQPPEKIAKSPPIGMPETVRIVLADNDDIPPGGLYIGHNGRNYKLQAGVEVNVPIGIIDILDHAIASFPVVNPNTRRVDGFRQRSRFPYKRVA